MNKFRIGLFHVVVLAGMIVSCSKSNDLIESGSNKVEKTSSNDTYLISVMNDPDMDQFDKASMLLNETQLSSVICKKLIADSYNPYIIEVVLATQITLENDVLIDLIEDDGLNDATVLNVLCSKSPLSAPVLSALSDNRPSISLSDISKYNTDIKLMSMCDGKVIYTKRLVTSKSADGTIFMLQDAAERSFANTVSASDLNKMLVGCGGSWTCGDKTVTDKGDGVTIVSCLVSQKKCVKVLQPSKSLTADDQSIVDLLDNESLSDFEKGNQILELDSVSPNLMREIIDHRSSLDPFVFETIVLSNGKILEENLTKLIIDEHLNRTLLKNILIVNSPLSAEIKALVTKFHPSISLSQVGAFDESDIALSICALSLISGDEIEIRKTSSTSHEASVTNRVLIPLSSTASSDDIEKMADGCGGSRWVCGELVVTSTHAGVTKYVCQTPPNDKCLKLSKKENR